MNPVIREELPSDAAAIHAVTAAAFLNAPHTAHTEQFIVEALRKAGALTISLVAERGGEVVGHVALSPVSISDGSTGWFGRGPVSVKPEFQRKGIGSLLMQAALRLLRERGPPAAFWWGIRRTTRALGSSLSPAWCCPVCVRSISRHYYLAHRCPMAWLRSMKHSVRGANNSLQRTLPNKNARRC